jgi:hypothetical protein
MSVDQSIRSNSAGDENNPYSLIEFIKPPRWIFNTTDPIDTTGQNEWFFTNITTGDLFIKTFGTWTFMYNFGTGAPSPGITTLANDGAGAQWFKTVIGTTAHLRTMLSSSGKLTFTTQLNDIDIDVNLDSGDVGLANVQNIKSNFFGVADPTNFNDSSEGYAVGSFWLNRATNPSRLFICESANLTVAVWELLAGSGVVDNVANVGGGAGILRDITGGTANLKTLASSSGKITYLPTVSTIDIGVNINKSDVGLPLLINTKYVTQSAINPTVNDDASLGYVPGNVWVNTALLGLWVNQTNTVGAAFWGFIGPSSSFVRNDNDYAFVRKGAGPANTAFGSAGVTVLLNVGVPVYSFIDFRGDWDALNEGFGPICIQRGIPSNGLTNNQYLISYSWSGQLLSVPGTDTVLQFGMGVGNGSVPAGAPFVVGSTSTLIFRSGSELASTINTSFVYRTPSALDTSFFLNVVNLTNTITLSTSDITIIFQQI